jgi:putative tricarboxylic transport membrane protein
MATQTPEETLHRGEALPMVFGKTTTALFCALALYATGAKAADFVPASTVNVITHSGVGGANDVFGRALIQMIEREKLAPNTKFVLVNKTGGGSTNAMNYMNEKAGDNNTIGLFASNYISDNLVQKEATHSITEMTPIANLIVEPALVVVNPDSHINTLKDFIDTNKATPNKYKQSGGSPLGRDAVVRYVLMANTGAQWPYISFATGGERIAAVLGGHAELYVMDATETGDFIRSGKLKPIAQVSDKRIEGFPKDVPTIKEAGYDVQIPQQARGMIGPPGMSKEAVAYYQGLLQKVTETPSWKKYVLDNALDSEYMPADKLGPFLADYQNRMRSVLKSAGIDVIR